jgi:tRNA U34 5-methylaminomethyl-2-thiouridine-forming methyltransferase MnmC
MAQRVMNRSTYTHGILDDIREPPTKRHVEVKDLEVGQRFLLNTRIYKVTYKDQERVEATDVQFSSFQFSSFHTFWNPSKRQGGVLLYWTLPIEVVS